jgi:predicted transcriptional regulator
MMIMADETASTAASELNPIELASEITIAWLNNPNNRVNPEDVPAFLRNMHSTINDLASEPAAEEASAEQMHTPAVSPRSSIKPDFLISLIDGKPYKTLKRHLSRHGLTPADYRQRYGLKADYPMTAPNYSEMRRETARKIGLGSRSRNSDASTPETMEEAPTTPPAAFTTRRPRRPVAAHTAEDPGNAGAPSKATRARKPAGGDDASPAPATAASGRRGRKPKAQQAS